jgi:hypothetical protein
LHAAKSNDTDHRDGYIKSFCPENDPDLAGSARKPAF